MASEKSRPGAKAKFEKEYILWALPKGETDRLHERPIVEGIKTPSQMDEAKRKAASQGWHGFRVQILDMSKPFRWMSRPGAKAKFALGTASIARLKEALRKHGDSAKQYDMIAWIVVRNMIANPKGFQESDVEGAIANLKLASDKHSRSGAKDVMAVNPAEVRKSFADDLAQMMRVWNKIMADAKKQFPNASSEELYQIAFGAFRQQLKMSRPGAKAQFAVEDRFYFGK